MLPDTFAYAIFRFTRRTPFQTFVIEFTSGDRLHVRHPETVFCRGSIYFHISPHDEYRIFDHTEIAQVFDVTNPIPTIDELMEEPEGDDPDDN